MATLYLLNVSIDNNTLNCGGTFITRNVILTAGHCLTRIHTGTSFVSVGYGNADRRKIKLCNWNNNYKPSNCSKKFTRGIKNVIVHDKYSEGNLQNDIGLVFLDRPVKFSSVVRPICLPYSEELLKGWEDTKLKTIGWGMVNKYGAPGPRVFSQVALETEIHIKERQYCDQFHNRVYGNVKGSRFCGGGRPGYSTCSGDSGGPLLKSLPVPLLDGKERVFQIGIVSSGTTSSCGYQGRPHIFTNVLFHMPWILDKLSRNFTFDSVESFSAELTLNSGETSNESQFSSSDSKMYKNELSTGLEIDVVSHPNIKKLPNFDVCGSIPGPKPNVTKKIDDDEEDEGEDENESEEFDDASNKTIRKKRLIGGRYAGIGWFPFLGQVYARDAHTAQADLRCGAVIISSTVLLTAAHCLSDIPAPWGLDSVRVGNYNRNKSNECIGTECFETKSVAIADIIVHKDYTKFTQENNIALIRLAEELQFNRVIQPICLPTSESVVEELMDTKMISVGWGKVMRSNLNNYPDLQQDRGPSNLPKYIEVNLRPRADCDRVYTRTLGTLDRSTLCGGGDSTSGGGECSADGGGPLMKLLMGSKNGSIVKKYIQFGIISFNECGQQGMPTTYTNLIYYLPWILDNI